MREKEREIKRMCERKRVREGDKKRVCVRERATKKECVREKERERDHPAHIQSRP